MSKIFFSFRMAVGAICLLMIYGWTLLYLIVEPRT